jgi:lipoprotein-releasing system ATP-binding protein
MLVAHNIHKTFGKLKVLKGIDLTVDKGEIVSIVGASGAGKSTLLHILGTLDTPEQGEVTLSGKSVFKLRNRQLANFRNHHIGFIFQFHNLLPEFTALENVCMPGFIAGEQVSAIEKRAKNLLIKLGMSERMEHKPGQLSGGEQQRVSVARALINDPDVVFADEPSGNLDSQNAHELHKLFFELRSSMDQTFVIVTHNDELANMADRKLEIKDGTILGSKAITDSKTH